MKYFYLLIFIFIVQNSALAQFQADTVSGQPGEDIKLLIKFRTNMVSDTGLYLTGSFILTNPSVFYPEQFCNSNASSIKEQTISRLNDTLFNFSIKFLKDNDTSLTFYLQGKALAGYDTISDIKFNNINCSGVSYGDFIGTVISSTNYGFVPYVRFADIKDCYPNPVYPNSITTWEYSIDKISDIKFEIYDLSGKMMSSTIIFGKKPGDHTYSLQIDDSYTSGKYFLFFYSNTSSYHKEFVVVR